MKTGTHVHLSKVSTQNPGLLVDGYDLWGHLSADLVVGETIEVARYRRVGRTAGEPALMDLLGRFESSPVRALVPQPDGSVIAQTQNSHWRVVALPAREAA